MGDRGTGQGPDGGLLGALILSERQRRALTREELAALMRRSDRTLTTSARSVKGWETSARTPSPAALRALATALDRPVEDLTAAAHGSPAAQRPWEGAVDVTDEHEMAESIRATVRDLVGFEVRHGGNEPGPLASRCLEGVRRRLGEGGAGVEVVSAAAELAEVSGWLLHDADRQSAARRMMHEALHLARLAGDRDMELFTLGLLAFVELWDGRPGTALVIARSALAQPLTSRQVAMFALREGRALAALQDRPGATRAMERARSALLDGVGSEEPGWAWWLDEAELIHHEGRVLDELGEHRAALDLLRRANQSCPRSRISGRFNYLAHTAESAVAAGAWPEAESLLRDLLPGVGVVGSGRTERVLRQTLGDLDASAPPTLRELGRAVTGRLGDPAS